MDFPESIHKATVFPILSSNMQGFHLTETSPIYARLNKWLQFLFSRRDSMRALSDGLPCDRRPLLLRVSATILGSTKGSIST